MWALEDLNLRPTDYESVGKSGILFGFSKNIGFLLSNHTDYHITDIRIRHIRRKKEYVFVQAW